MLSDNLLLALALALRVCSLWFFLTALLFWKKTKPYPRARPRTRFACLIPARNEEAVIAALVESLRAQDYPAALFDVYVIPNNCTDNTEETARAAGARIFRCPEPVTCKGDALRQAVAHLLPRGYDAFCVFDADNLVNSCFLARMNDAFRAGAGVAKARMEGKNPAASAVAGCYALYFRLFEVFFNRSRANLGLSAKLVGTGFAVSRRVLERLGGWNTRTMAEDAEFSALCAALDERVFWVPEAVAYDESPLTLRLSLRQRRRWCSGIMEASRRALPRLLRSLLRAPTRRRLDGAVFLCAPFVQALSVLPALALLFTSPVSSLISLAAGYILTALLAVLLSGRNVRGAALFPLFLAAWVPLTVLSALRPVRRWQAIPHGASGGASPRSGALEKRGGRTGENVTVL